LERNELTARDRPTASGAPVVLRSRRVVTPEGIRVASLHLSGGTIARVSTWDDCPPGSHVVDYENSVMMPGLVDTHVHVNEPGRTEWDGCASATRGHAVFR
jgi:allantoinase